MASSIYNQCKKESCGCQRYLPKDDIPDECFYCNHSTGYHESKTINITEYPYGPCNKIQCGCQRFKKQSLDSLLCVYCNHYNGFHSDWPIPRDTQTDDSSQVVRHVRNILKIKVVVCLDRVTPNIIPKIGSPLWNDLDSRNMIKKNVEISTHSSSTEINDLIFDLFPDHLNGQNWCLFNSSSGVLKKVSYNEITCDLIKQNLTKTKKMYIAPDTVDISKTFNVLDVPDFDVINVTEFSNFDGTLQQKLELTILPLKG